MHNSSNVLTATNEFNSIENLSSAKSVWRTYLPRNSIGMRPQQIQLIMQSIIHRIEVVYTPLLTNCCYFHIIIEIIALHIWSIGQSAGQYFRSVRMQITTAIRIVNKHLLLVLIRLIIADMRMYNYVSPPLCVFIHSNKCISYAHCNKTHPYIDTGSCCETCVTTKVWCQSQGAVHVLRIPAADCVTYLCHYLFLLWVDYS